jgi:hypothetical protein
MKPLNNWKCTEYIFIGLGWDQAIQEAQVPLTTHIHNYNLIPLPLQYKLLRLNQNSKNNEEGIPLVKMSKYNEVVGTWRTRTSPISYPGSIKQNRSLNMYVQKV